MRTISNSIKNSDFIKAVIESYEDNQKAVADKEKKASESLFVYEQSVYDIKNQINNNYVKYDNFIESVNSVFLAEALYDIFSESVPDEYKVEENSEAFMRGIVNDFINENGVYNILRNMKYRSSYLSTLHNYITEAVEDTKKKNEFDPSKKQDFNIPEDTVDEFLDKLDFDKEELVNTISTNVNSAIKKFIEQNLKDSKKLKKISQATANKIEEQRTKMKKDEKSEEEQEAMEESYNLIAKSEMNKIRNRPQSIFESMVTNLSEAALKNDEFKDAYITEGHIDMEKIVNKCAILYTFLETVNVTKLEIVNHEYIQNMLNSMK